MKRYRCLLIILFLAIIQIVHGEETGITLDDFSESAIYASLWSERASGLQESTIDPDCGYLLEDIVGTLQDVSYLLLESKDANKLLSVSIGEIEPTENSSNKLPNATMCETAYLNEMNSILQVSTYRKDNYYSATISYYDNEGVFWATKTIAAAMRENGDILFYLNIYDDGNYLSNRCIVLCDESGEKALFIRSLGNIQRTVINVEQWQTGVDYEWGEWLLYSVE